MTETVEDFQDELIFDEAPPRSKPVKITPDSAMPNPNRTTAVQRDAKAASAVLAQLNNVICLGIMAVGFPATASAISNGNEDFEQAAYEALLNDPQLAKTILRAGATGGKTALVVAYLSLAVGAVPVGVMEYRARKELREGPDAD